MRISILLALSIGVLTSVSAVGKCVSNPEAFIKDPKFEQIHFLADHQQYAGGNSSGDAYFQWQKKRGKFFMNFAYRSRAWGFRKAVDEPFKLCEKNGKFSMVVSNGTVLAIKPKVTSSGKKSVLLWNHQIKVRFKVAGAMARRSLGVPRPPRSWAKPVQREVASEEDYVPALVQADQEPQAAIN